MSCIIRVFPRRTSYTPTDNMAFTGYPPLIRPEADEVHISTVFTWDTEHARRLELAWRQYYPVVKLGGPAFGDPGGEFTPGMYVKQGVTITSRGCPYHCPYCLVPERDGKLRTVEIKDGYIIQDDNLTAAPWVHWKAVMDMCRRQPKSIKFAGGLKARILTNDMIADLKSLRIDELWLACDTDDDLYPLIRATERLNWLRRDQLRCYVLCAYGNETIDEALDRLVAVWKAGCLPFAQLYQPSQGRINYSREWRELARTWSRPAAMKTLMEGETGQSAPWKKSGHGCAVRRGND